MKFLCYSRARHTSSLPVHVNSERGGGRGLDQSVWQPLIRIMFNFTDNERKMVRFVAEKGLTQLIAGMDPAFQPVRDSIADFDSVPYQSTHINDRTVMGTDPSPGVLA
jgi:hypothetical protein